MCDKELLRKSSMKSPANTVGRVKKKRRHVLIRIPDSDKPCRFRTKILVAGLALVVIVAAVCAYLFTTERRRVIRECPDPEVPPPPSPSILHVFQKAAVCTDAPYCSKVGKSILTQNGSAVDAAIAAMFCNGLLNQQSMGIGGGFFMTVYIRDEERAYTVNAREKAPLKATVDMFHGKFDLSSKGPLAVGVPGEVRGMWQAWQRWGKLPWESLIAPTLELCKEGFVVSSPLYDGLTLAPYIKNDANLKKQYYNPTTGLFARVGSVVKPSNALCRTLKRISEKGGDELYNGSLAQDFVEDLARIGSIITEEDLKEYQATISDPVEVPIGTGDVLYAPPPPSSGIILAFILNILSGYNFTSADIQTIDDKILTYARIVEAFKYAYAVRTNLADADFVNASDYFQLLSNITDPWYGGEVRRKINHTLTSNDAETYGATVYNKEDAGTAHISIIAPNGDAVSVTSSINFFYGAGFSTLNTGIVMNNVMDDFSSPGVTNYFGLKPSPANFIAPGKRPLSSMCPSIIVDGAGNAKMVIGASGGTKITTAVAFVIMNKLWFDLSIKQAVDEPRIHHQIFPMELHYEYGVVKEVLDGLKEKGHVIHRYRGRGSIVCALYRNESGIYANSDFRKGGDVAGFD